MRDQMVSAMQLSIVLLFYLLIAGPTTSRRDSRDAPDVVGFGGSSPVQRSNTHDGPLTKLFYGYQYFSPASREHARLDKQQPNSSLLFLVSKDQSIRWILL
jgi:hypothetical protein